jgi:hypothetical protein
MKGTPLTEAVKKKSKKENRYSGTDTIPWKAVNVSGKSPLKDHNGADETFAGYKQANEAAVRFTNETGELLTAVRS